MNLPRFKVNIGTHDGGEEPYKGLNRTEDTPQNINMYEIMEGGISAPSLDSTIDALERNNWEKTETITPRNSDGNTNIKYELEVDGHSNPELHLVSSEEVPSTGTSPTRAEVKLKDDYPGDVRREIAQTIHRLGEITYHPMFEDAYDPDSSTEEVLNEYIENGTTWDDRLSELDQ